MDARSGKVDERSRVDEPTSGAKCRVPGVRCEALVLVRGGYKRQPGCPFPGSPGVAKGARGPLSAVYCLPSTAYRLVPAIPGQATFPPPPRIQWTRADDPRLFV